MNLISDMAKIHAGISELKASHVHLISASNMSEGAPRYLLLYYAAECGLKCAHLRRNNLLNTERLGELDHNLDSLIKDLKLSRTAIGDAPGFRLSRSESENLHHSDAHQAWRYGVRILAADEKKLAAWLESICKAVKEHI